MINVLSDFDGCSTAQMSLQKVGIEVNNYFASEINPDAIELVKRKFPKTIHLGDVQNVNISNLPKIDLLVGGSPCQGFSIAGKLLNFDDDRSKLFFEFVKHKNALNPTYFFYENVRISDDETLQIISKSLGVNPVFINSKKFTGQSRKRFYWTNIPFLGYPKDDTKRLKDVIDWNVPFDVPTYYLLSKTVYAPSESTDGIITINPRQNNGRQTGQRSRIYDIEGYSPAICKTLFDLWITADHKTCRKLTIPEICRLQGVPTDFFEGVNKSKAGAMLGDAWTVDVVAAFFGSLKKSIK